MTLPAEYSDASEALVAFRQRLLRELVSGRVKALLDAEHVTMQKMATQIDNLAVTPYMFSVIKGKALALRLNDHEVGLGEIHQSRINFSMGKAEYPNVANPVVAARELPQVDVFQYTPPSNLELIEKVNEEVWASLFVLQTGLKVFKETTDATNVSNDYYKFRAIGRSKVEITLSSPAGEFTNWTSITGEATKLVRDVTKVDDDLLCSYEIWVIVDGNFHGTDNTVGVVPLAILVLNDMSTIPEMVIAAGGKHFSSKDAGLYASWTMGNAQGGWTKTHGGYTVVSDVSMWANSTTLTLAVNDAALGSLSPVVGDYTKKATDSVLVTATATEGNTVKSWELDSVEYEGTDTFTVKCHENHVLTCIFQAGGTAILRPTAAGDVTDLNHSGANTNWECCDEEISDGLTTVVYCNLVGHWKRDLYALGTASLPEGAVVDWIEFYARVKRYGTNRVCYCAFSFKTNGSILDGALTNFNDWAYHLLSQRFLTNPVTNEAWTATEVEALQAGCRLDRIYATGDPSDTGYYCTQVYAHVKYHVP